MAETRPIRGVRALAALLSLLVLVAACGSASTTSPGPGSSAAGGGSASSAATASGADGTGASPGTPGQADPAATLQIAKPYAIAALPAATADSLQATFTRDLGAFGKAVRIGARAITSNGANVGFLLAVGFPRQTLNDTTFTDAVSTLEAGAEQSFSRQIILNVEVTTGTLGGGAVGMFRTGDTLTIVLAASPALVVPAVTALISANG
jgi:hypothetical protein